MLLSVSTTRRARRGMVREWRLHVLSIFSLAVAFVCLGAALLEVRARRIVVLDEGKAVDVPQGIASDEYDNRLPL